MSDVAGALARIADALEAIRDRLPATEGAGTRPMSLFGYTAGQDRPPDAGLAELAERFLRGGIGDASTRYYPAAAWDLASEIAERFRSTPCTCPFERSSLWNPTLRAQICGTCRRLIPDPAQNPT
jgi:hypothetical protein